MTEYPDRQYRIVFKSPDRERYYTKMRDCLARTPEQALFKIGTHNGIKKERHGRPVESRDAVLVLEAYDDGEFHEVCELEGVQVYE